MSAETAQGIPKFESAPLMIPHGKQRCMLVDCVALFSESWDKSTVSSDGSDDMRESQRNRLSCNTKVPCKNKHNPIVKVHTMTSTFILIQILELH